MVSSGAGFFIVAIIAIICSLSKDVDAKSPVQIVAGDDATIEEFPWLVSLRNIRKKHFCGGSLITNKHVLTAAHCVVKWSAGKTTYDYELHPSTITVQAGSSSSLEYKNVHEVAKIHKHELFAIPGTPLWSHDVAILTLKDPIVEDSRQRPIALPSSDVKAGHIGSVAGWGLTNENIRVASPTLKKAVMTVLSDYKCQYTLGHYAPKMQFCAFKNNRVGFCNGDSGGPFVVNNEIVGLVSNSIKCNGPYPYTYTDVYNYLDWITKILDAEK